MENKKEESKQEPIETAGDLSGAALGYALPTERDKNEMPEPGINILAIVRHWYTGGRRFAVLWIVDKHDGCYRTVDDNSELSHDWNVIAWDYLPELRKKA